MLSRREEKIKAVVDKRDPALTLVFENIHDPHNLSAILRTCDAVGIGDVHLLYTIEKFPRLGIKSSSSAKKWVATHKWQKEDECFGSLKKAGFTIVATHLAAESQSLYQSDLRGRIALVVGNEHRGISEKTLSLCDQNIFIPMVGMVQSLNVSVATAVILYEAFRQRRET